MNAYIELIPRFLRGLAEQLDQAREESRTADPDTAAAALRGTMTAVATMLQVDADALEREVRNGTHSTVE